MASVIKIAPYCARGPRPPAPRMESALSMLVRPGDRGVKVSRAVTIRKPAAELYAFWREAGNLAAVIGDLASITRISDQEAHWSVSMPPGDRRVEWDARLVEDRPGRFLVWRSCECAEFAGAGSVRFELAPGDEGTEVTVNLEYLPREAPGAPPDRFSAEEAGRRVDQVLRRFKALITAGEAPSGVPGPALELVR